MMLEYQFSIITVKSYNDPILFLRQPHDDGILCAGRFLGNMYDIKSILTEQDYAGYGNIFIRQEFHAFAFGSEGTSKSASSLKHSPA